MTLRGFISLALALMIALSSPATAVARTSAAATGQMVLCIGTQSLTVYTDAEGRPTAAPHFCPDCALVDAALPGAPSMGTTIFSPSVLHHTVPAPAVIGTAPRFAPRPRAPPLSV